MRAKLIFLFFIFSLLILSSCSQAKIKTLNLSMSLGEEEWQVMRKDIFPIFEKKYNIKINSYQIEAGQLATKLEALVKAKRQAIDLFAQDNMTLAILLEKGIILDLSDYENQIPKQVLANLVSSCKFNGRLMFMPFRPNVQIIYYNADAFRKYNLRPPRSWKELLEVARRFKEEEDEGKVLLKGFGGNPTATQVYEFILQAGGNPYAFNDSGCIKAFEFLQVLSPYLAKESKRAKWDSTNDILARGEAYIAANWPFGIMILIKRYGLNFIKTYKGWRGPEGEFHVIGGDVFGIPKNTENRELAIKFIQFMQTKEVQEILVSRLGWPSIREDAYTEAASWMKPYFASVRGALKHGVFRRNVTFWPAYEKYITQAFRDIVFSNAPVKETLDRYKQMLEKQIDYQTH